MEGMEGTIVVFCTFPSREVAAPIATKLVEEKLVACVNLLPGVKSIYRWEGKVESAQEVLGLMKTTASGYDALEARLKALHPYEVPELVALPASRVQPAYAKWVEESVGEPR